MNFLSLSYFTWQMSNLKPIFVLVNKYSIIFVLGISYHTTNYQNTNYEITK